MQKIGILLTNTGTPDAPNANAVRKYLREFLSDHRIVHLPKIIWLPILYGLVLPLRSKKSAKLYQNIWTPYGSPMRVIMQEIANQLEEKLKQDKQNEFCVAVGMNYGSPSIHDSLQYFRQQNIEEYIILPLFPQYSNTTTASTFDRFMSALQHWPALPSFRFIRNYASNPDYIRTLAASISHGFKTHGQPDQLLISFHGIPVRYIKAHDPYQKECELTAALLAEELHLSKDQWTLCYQSKFGYDEWLKPSTQDLFKQLPARGCKHIQVVCPGFSVDCLETVEEIAITGKEMFIHAGGQQFHYLPALNADHAHIDMLANIILEKC